MRRNKGRKMRPRDKKSVPTDGIVNKNRVRKNHGPKAMVNNT